MKNKSRIALICGGFSSERIVSLDSGRRVYSAINKDKYDVVVYDPLTDILDLVAAANEIDFAFIVLHGSCGEDGTIQGLLDLLDIPYQGSGVLSSAIAMNKVVSKCLFERAALLVAPYLVKNITNLLYSDCISHVEDKLGFPVIVKPVESGSSIGVSFVQNRDEFKAAISCVSQYDNSFLIESYIDGIEVTCGVLGNDDLEALPLIEIIYDEESSLFNYESKYAKGLVKEICPARISDDLTKKAQICAKKAHDTLYCRGYSRTDMILRDGNFYILETNTIPGMTDKSLYPKSAEVMGISFNDLIDRLIRLGLEGRREK